MRFLTTLLALALGLAVAAPANAWWQNDWPYRKAIDVDTSPSGVNVSGPIGRTLVLIRLHSGNFTFSDALDNGADIRFIAGDDKTPLPYHIESWDKDSGVATVWVSVPGLNGGNKTPIWLYYGNKNAPAGGDVAGTYDPDYQLVYHFDDTSGTPTSDKTANKNNAQSAPPGLNDGAIIGRGAKFSGGAAMTAPASPSLAIAANGPFTASAWVKQDTISPDATIVHRGAFTLGIANGTAYAAIGGARAQAQQALKPADWNHVAATFDAGKLTLYVNGIEAGSAQGAFPGSNDPVEIGTGFTGEMDELELSKVARPATMLMAEAQNEGPNDKLIAFGNDEKQGDGGGVVLYILKSTPVLDWGIIGICLIMLAGAAVVMWSKSNYISTAQRANAAFNKRFRAMHEDLVSVRTVPGIDAKEMKLLEKSPLFNLYEIGVEELEVRRAARGTRPLSGEAVEALRSAVDAQQVEENEKLDRWMVLLTIAISGGPFIGLLGTVMGVMKTFGGVAMAGDVNVNAIAPGIAAALLATIAGLACAIPSLFGYNYLNSKVTTIANEMRVFVDRLVTRLAEIQSYAAEHNPPPMPLAAE